MEGCQWTSLIACELKKGTITVDVDVIKDIKNGFFGFNEPVCVCDHFGEEGVVGQYVIVVEVFLESIEWVALDDQGFSSTIIAKIKSIPWETPFYKGGSIVGVCPGIGSTDNEDVRFGKAVMDREGEGWYNLCIGIRSYFINDWILVGEIEGWKGRVTLRGSDLALVINWGTATSCEAKGKIFSLKRTWWETYNFEETGSKHLYPLSNYNPKRHMI